jgi:hypothetical protein
MRQHDTRSHPMKGRAARANGCPHNAELVGDWLALRQQLAVVTASSAVVTSHQLKCCWSWNRSEACSPHPMSRLALVCSAASETPPLRLKRSILPLPARQCRPIGR